MPGAEEVAQRFALRPAALLRQRRGYRIALAWYLSGGVILTGSAAWAAGRPASAVAAGLIALSAAQLDYYAFAVVTQLWLISRGLRRAGTPAGELVLGPEGIRVGRELIAWRDVESVRARQRGSMPHVALAARRPGRRAGRRKKRAIRGSYYGVHLDELAAAIERYSPVAGAVRPRGPARDDETGTITFFFNDRLIRALRHFHLLSLMALALMAGPAAAGLFVVRQPLPAAFVLLVGGGFVVNEWGKVAQASRRLRVSRGGLGRLLLTPGHLTLAGTDTPIPWSHVQAVTVTRNRRPGLGGTIVCPDPDPAPDCGLRGRTAPFHIAQSLYYTTPDQLGAAFARYTRVDDGREGAARTG